jgi:hypothetical protein
MSIIYRIGENNQKELGNNGNKNSERLKLNILQCITWPGRMRTSMYNSVSKGTGNPQLSTEDNERLQLGARSRLLLQSLSIKLVQEGPVELDSRRTLQFETGRS